jgi:pyrroline-5-carboxylate reductase
LADRTQTLSGKNIGVIGMGSMGGALVEGMLSARAVEPTQLMVSARRRERLDRFAQRTGVRVAADNSEVAAWADVLILAVKPQILDRVLDEIATAFKAGALAVSVAAGFPTSAIAKRLQTRVVRAMPNTPALVRLGATGIAAGEGADEDDLAIAQCIFDAVGMTVVLDEAQLDAVTGLSGSGPSYVFLIIEALSDAGVKMGLHREHALALAAQTVLGSAKLLLETGEHPGRLKDMVTSPGGTAIAGLHTLEAGGLRTTLINAVETATLRARELGRK